MSESLVVAETIASVRASVAEARARDLRIALVPTMGALHGGHLALVSRAREVADFVIVSIFVNPLQFGPGEDLDRYPRDLAADLETLAGVAVVFAPSVDELYPGDEAGTRITAGHIGTLYEGSVRPGHFDGVLTVVGKLLNIVRPDTVLFGQKDAQQVFLVRRMVADLNIPVAVEVVEIVREDSGLALSSRNRYLDAQQRTAARALSQALGAAVLSARGGAAAALAAAHAVVGGEPLVEVDYLELVDRKSFLPVADDHPGPALMIIAARVGTALLIDNMAITLG